MGERSAETTLTTLRDVRDDHHVHHCEVEGSHDQNHTITASGGCHQLPVQVVDPNQVILHNTQLLPLLVVVIITEICKSPTLWLKANKCGQKGSLSIFFFSCMTCAMFTLNVSCHHTHQFKQMSVLRCCPDLEKQVLKYSFPHFSLLSFVNMAHKQLIEICLLRGKDQLASPTRSPAHLENGNGPGTLHRQPGQSQHGRIAPVQLHPDNLVAVGGGVVQVLVDDVQRQSLRGVVQVGLRHRADGAGLPTHPGAHDSVLTCCGFQPVHPTRMPKEVGEEMRRTQRRVDHPHRT